MTTKPTTELTAAELRLRAEERLRLNSEVSGGASAVETQRLLHELQVHQIELELQNEELRDARAATEASLARLADLYDFAPVGYLTLTRDGAITQANLMAAQLLVLDRVDLVGWRLGLSVAASDLGLFNDFLQETFSTDNRQTCDLMLVTEEQPTRVVQFDARRSPGGQECRAVLVDITERKRIKEALRDSEERQRLALDAGQMGTFDWDIQRGHVAWSRWHQELWGFAPGEFDGTYEAITRRIHPEDLPGIRAEIARCIAAREPFTREYRILWPDGSVHWVLSRGEFSFDADQKPVRMRGVVKEITERKLAEEIHRVNEIQLAGIVGSAMDGIITIDGEHRIVLFNTAAEVLFGYGRDQVIHQPIEMLIPEHHRVSHRAHIQDFARTGITTRKMGGSRPVVGWRSSGEEFPLEASISQIEVAGRRFFTAIVRDISERLRSETRIREDAERLRLLSQKVLHAQEAERRHLARELHDEIGQVLCALSVNMKIVKTKVDPSARPRLEESIQILDQAIDQVRNLSLDLRPAVLDDFGLESALRWYLDRLAARTSLRVHLKAEQGDLELPADLRIACFRVAQEALTNVVRHAAARRVEVELTQDAEEVRLTIRDDGKGFDVNAARRRASKGGSLGLLGMQERVELLNGRIHLQSAPGTGTVVQIRLPILVAPVSEAP